MTNLQALQAEIEPYSASSTLLEKVLTDHSLTGSDTYTDKTAIAKATITVLKRFIVIASEGEGQMSTAYNVEGLKKRIEEIAADNSLSGAQYSIQPKIKDASNRW